MKTQSATHPWRNDLGLLKLREARHQHELATARARHRRYLKDPVYHEAIKEQARHRALVRRKTASDRGE